MNEDKKVADWFKALEETTKELTEWETDFIASVKAQWERKGTLSPKQLEVLERIYADKSDL